LLLVDQDELDEQDHEALIWLRYRQEEIGERLKRGWHDYIDRRPLPEAA
jgi:hypothetical protein